MAFLCINTGTSNLEKIGVFNVKSRNTGEEVDTAIVFQSFKPFSTSRQNPFCRQFLPESGDQCVYCSSLLSLCLFMSNEPKARSKFLHETGFQISSWITLIPTNQKTAEIIFCSPRSEAGFAIATNEYTITLQIPSRIGLLSHFSLMRLKKETQENRRNRPLTDYPFRPNKSELIIQAGTIFVLPLDRKFFVLVPGNDAKYFIKEFSHSEMNVTRIRESSKGTQETRQDDKCGECNKDHYHIAESGKMVLNLQQSKLELDRDEKIHRDIMIFNYRDPKPDPSPLFNREPSINMEENDEKVSREMKLYRIIEVTVKHGLYQRPKASSATDSIMDVSLFEFEFKVPIPKLFKLFLHDRTKPNMSQRDEMLVATLANSKLGVVMADKIFYTSKVNPNLEFELVSANVSEKNQFPLKLKIHREAFVQLLAPNGEGYTLDYKTNAHLRCTKLVIADYDYEKKQLVTKQFGSVKHFILEVPYGRISIHCEENGTLNITHNKNLFLFRQ